jgi:hypothetical protein
VHLLVGLGPFDRAPDLARHLEVDRVEPLRPVQAQAGDARLSRIALDPQRAEGRHGAAAQLAAKQ